MDSNWLLDLCIWAGQLSEIKFGIEEEAIEY